MVLLCRQASGMHVFVCASSARSRGGAASSRDDTGRFFNALSGKVTGSASLALNRAETVPEAHSDNVVAFDVATDIYV
jgi:hypothetical protein